MDSEKIANLMLLSDREGSYDEYIGWNIVFRYRTESANLEWGCTYTMSSTGAANAMLIDFGDGTSQSYDAKTSATSITNHVFAEAGEYIIKVRCAALTRFLVAKENANFGARIPEILKWNCPVFTNMSNCLEYLSALEKPLPKIITAGNPTNNYELALRNYGQSSIDGLSIGINTYRLVNMLQTTGDLDNMTSLSEIFPYWWQSSAIDISGLCAGRSRLSDIKGNFAERLWRCSDVSWVISAPPFADCAASLRARIPSTWGGTDNTSWFTARLSVPARWSIDYGATWHTPGAWVRVTTGETYTVVFEDYSFLPDGYEELDKVVADGRQYIVTGVAMVSGNGFYVDFTPDKSAEQVVFSTKKSSTDSTGQRLITVAGTGSVTIHCAGATKSYGTPASDDDYKIFGLVSSNTYLTGGTLSHSSWGTRDSSGRALTLFGYYSAEAGAFSGEFRRLVICKGNTRTTKVADFVPCRRTSDGAVGIFDLESSTFVESAGTAPLAAGRRVSTVKPRPYTFTAKAGDWKSVAFVYNKDSVPVASDLVLHFPCNTPRYGVYRDNDETLRTAAENGMVLYENTVGSATPAIVGGKAALSLTTSGYATIRKGNRIGFGALRNEDGEFTFSVWSSATATSGTRALLAIGEANTGTILELAMTTGYQNRSLFYKSTAVDFTSAACVSGVLVHSAVTVTGRRHYKCYIGGELVKEGDAEVDIVPSRYESGVRVGYSTIGSHYSNTVRIADLRMYPRALSDAEIAELALGPNKTATAWYEDIPYNQLWYYAPSKAVLTSTEGVLSHDFADGRGILSFSGMLRDVREWLSGNAGITGVRMPNTVSRISDNAFRNCSGISTIELSSSLAEVGAHAFDGCTSMSVYKLPNTLRTIGDYAFYGCAGLRIQTLPSATSSIGDYAFADCTGLRITEIPGAVTAIGGNAFYHVWNGVSEHTLVIVNSHISISANSFAGNDGLRLVVPWVYGAVAGAPWGLDPAQVVYVDYSEGLVFHASLNGATPTVAETGQALTASGTVAYGVVDGIACADSSRSNGYLSVGGVSAFPALTAPRTLSFWIRTGTGASDGAAALMYGGTASGNTNWGCYVLTTGMVQVIAGAKWYDLNSISTGVWHNVAITYDGNTLHSLYIDGVSSVGVTTAKATNVTGGTRNYIWRYSTNTRNKGDIAGVRLYNRVLTQPELTALAAEYQPTRP